MQDVYKLIKDIKSELPNDLMSHHYKAIDNSFQIVTYLSPRISVDVAEEILRMTFENLFGQAYEPGDWLDRIYNIIDGRLIKP